MSDCEDEVHWGTFIAGALVGAIIVAAAIGFALAAQSSMVPPTQGTITKAYPYDSHYEYIIAYQQNGQQRLFNASMLCQAYSVGQNVTFGNNGSGNTIFEPSYPGC